MPTGSAAIKALLPARLDAVERVTSLHTQVRCETSHIRGGGEALDRTTTLREEEKVSMLTSRGNNKRTNQDREQPLMLALFAITTGLVLAIAAFVGIVF